MRFLGNGRADADADVRADGRADANAHAHAHADAHADVDVYGRGPAKAFIQWTFCG